MKWYWVCQCGTGKLETDESSVFCMTLWCYQCGKRDVLAIKVNRYSIMEKLSALIRKCELGYMAIESISEDEQVENFKRMYPEQYARERNEELNGTGI